MKNHANVAIIDPGITSFVFIFLFGVYLYKLIIIITSVDTPTTYLRIFQRYINILSNPIRLNIKYPIDSPKTNSIIDEKIRTKILIVKIKLIINTFINDLVSLTL